MTWLSRMSGTWQSASHHLKILNSWDMVLTRIWMERIAEQKRKWKRESPKSASAGAVCAWIRKWRSSNSVRISDGRVAKCRKEEQQRQHQQQQQSQMPAGLSTGVGVSADAALALQPGIAPDDMSGMSVPGPIGAPMYLSRHRNSYQLAPAIQDDLQAQFQAQGQNPGLLFRLACDCQCYQHGSFTQYGHVRHFRASKCCSFSAFAQSCNSRERWLRNGERPSQSKCLPQTARHELLGAMPLASEDALSWANFTSSYIEALNGMTSNNFNNGIGVGMNAATTTGATASFPPPALACNFHSRSVIYHTMNALATLHFSLTCCWNIIICITTSHHPVLPYVLVCCDQSSLSRAFTLRRP